MWSCASCVFYSNELLTFHCYNSVTAWCIINTTLWELWSPFLESIFLDNLITWYMQVHVIGKVLNRNILKNGESFKVWIKKNLIKNHVQSSYLHTISPVPHAANSTICRKSEPPCRTIRGTDVRAMFYSVQRTIQCYNYDAGCNSMHDLAIPAISTDDNTSKWSWELW